MAHEINRLPTTYQVPRGCLRSKSTVSPVHRQHSIQLLGSRTGLSAANFRQIRLTNLHEKRKQLVSEHERAVTHISFIKQQFVVFPPLSGLCHFKLAYTISGLRNFKKYTDWITASETPSKYCLAETKVQLDAVDGRILRGDNNSGEAVNLRPIELQCVGVWISTGLLCMCMYMCIYAHIQSTISISIMTCAKFHLRRALQNVTHALSWEVCAHSRTPKYGKCYDIHVLISRRLVQTPVRKLRIYSKLATS
jgi:hypothetical protein